MTNTASLPAPPPASSASDTSPARVEGGQEHASPPATAAPSSRFQFAAPTPLTVAPFAASAPPAPPLAPFQTRPELSQAAHLFDEKPLPPLPGTGDAGGEGGGQGGGGRAPGSSCRRDGAVGQFGKRLFPTVTQGPWTDASPIAGPSGRRGLQESFAAATRRARSALVGGYFCRLDVPISLLTCRQGWPRGRGRARERQAHCARLQADKGDSLTCSRVAAYMRTPPGDGWIVL